MTIGERLYTVDEFTDYATNHPDSLLELIDGRIIEKVTGLRHGKIALRIGAKLVQWADETGADGHFATEVHHRAADGSDNVFLPDVSFVYSADDATDAPVDQFPDFAVEVKSPGNDYSELRQKAQTYLKHGTKLVWLVYPGREIVEVYQADGSSELFTREHTLSGGDVLPDFKMTVTEVFNI
jgi:Uma2 family endonuclease